VHGAATRHAANAHLCESKAGAEDIVEFRCPPTKNEVGGRDIGVRQTVRRIGSGDFTLSLIFSLQWADRTAASIGFSDGHRIGFDGRGGIFTEGGSWPKTQSYDFRLEPRRWYHLVATRQAGILNVSFDGSLRIASKPMIGRITSAQLRPWRNQVRVRTFSLSTLNHRQHFNSSEAKFAANLVAASYYPLAVPIGRHPQHCIDSGRLHLPHDVRASVVQTTTHEVRGAPVSVTVATVTPGRDGPVPDIYLLFPGVAGDQHTRIGELRRMMDSHLRETPRQVRSLQFLDAGRARVLPHFADVFASLWPSVLRSVRALLDAEDPGAHGRIVVSGHSLGGAVADLAAVHLALTIVSAGLRPAGWRPTLYTMGQPRTGDFAFANIVDGLTEAWRIVHRQDPVPHMPPCSMLPHHDCEAQHSTAHYHHGTEIWYEHSMSHGHRENYRMCENPSHNYCSMSLYAPASVSDHRIYYGVPLSYQCLTH